jgi:hypothetical protein
MIDAGYLTMFAYFFAPLTLALVLLAGLYYAWQRNQPALNPAATETATTNLYAREEAERLRMERS